MLAIGDANVTTEIFGSDLNNITKSGVCSFYGGFMKNSPIANGYNVLIVLAYDEHRITQYCIANFDNGNSEAHKRVSRYTSEGMTWGAWSKQE